MTIPGDTMPSEVHSLHPAARGWMQWSQQGPHNFQTRVGTYTKTHVAEVDSTTKHAPLAQGAFCFSLTDLTLLAKHRCFDSAARLLPENDPFLFPEA
jgi:hypothetical protein